MLRKLLLMTSAVMLTWGGVATATAAADPGSVAAGIRNNPGIVLLTSHPSGNVDPSSTARQNIVDTSEGRPARTSPWSDVGVRNVPLAERMLIGMRDLNARGYTFRVTEIVGGDHSSNSRHYVGVAFDVDTINGVRVNSTNPHFRGFMDACRSLGATEVLGPGNTGHATHVHCAWPR